MLGMLIIPLEIFMMACKHFCISCASKVFKMYAHTVWNLPQICHFSHIWNTFWETPGLKDKVRQGKLYLTLKSRVTWRKGPSAFYRLKIMFCTVQSVLFPIFSFTTVLLQQLCAFQISNNHAPLVKQGSTLQEISLKCSSASTLKK